MVKNKKTLPPKPFYKNVWFWVPTAAVIAVVISIMIAFRVSPWPGALVIRTVFNRGGGNALRAMEKYTPDRAVTVIENQHYQPGNKDAYLDVYYPSSVKKDQRLPVLIWTHGGAWLSGNKKDSAPYFKLLADKGYVVVAPNYSLAPDKKYPTAIHQLNEVYGYLQTHAELLHIDTAKFALAGDSAGANLSAQMAALITNPAYAKEVSITPKLKPEQLKTVILYCGIYKMEGLTEHPTTLPKVVGWGDDVTVWAYSGTRDFSAPIIRQMSPYYHVTSAFPTTFISGGNGDPLTNVQSKPLSEKLSALGVNTTTLYYNQDYQPLLPHEYQFNLDTSDGQKALQDTIEFLDTKLK